MSRIQSAIVRSTLSFLLLIAGAGITFATAPPDSAIGLAQDATCAAEPAYGGPFYTPDWMRPAPSIPSSCTTNEPCSGDWWCDYYCVTFTPCGGLLTSGTCSVPDIVGPGVCVCTEMFPE